MDNDRVGRFSTTNATPESLVSQYIEATPLGILLVNEAGVITYANASALACFRYGPGELTGQPIEVLVPTVLRSAHMAWRSAFMQEPKARLMAGRELMGRRKDGTTVPVALGLNPLSGFGTIRVACTILDLTEVTRAEQDMRRFFDLSLDLFCIANFAGFFVRVNPNFSRVLGYPDELLLTRPFVEFVHPDDVDATHQAVAELSHGRPIVRFRNRYRRARGDYRWFEWSSRAMIDEDLIFATARDITEQVQLEDQLIARERRERAILENTPAVVYVKNIDGCFEYVNPRYAELFSLDADSVLGKRDEDLYSDELAEPIRARDELVLREGKPLTTHEIIPQPDGPHTFLSTKFPLFDAQGQIAAMASISTDITPQMRARETDEQLRLARAFQRKLYPTKAPNVPGLEAAGSAVPVAQVCGDYYDFVTREPGRLIVGMGDVSGHGIGPALEMVAVRTAMRMLLRAGTSLQSAVMELNLKLCEDLPESCFVSLFLAELDAPQRRIRYIGAGHEAMLIRADGPHRLGSTGPLLGILESAEFEEHTVENLDLDDIFLLATDGLSEAMDMSGQQFSTAQIGEVAARGRGGSAEEVIGTVFRSVYEFASGKTIADDMTLVAVKFVE